MPAEPLTGILEVAPEADVDLLVGHRPQALW